VTESPVRHKLYRELYSTVLLTQQFFFFFLKFDKKIILEATF